MLFFFTAYTQILQMLLHRITADEFWTSRFLLTFHFKHGSFSSVLFSFFYYWLWLFLSLNAALIVLVCSQCSTTRHSCLSVALHFSSCVWHSTRRFFDVLLENCVSSGVGCWASETTLARPFLRARCGICCVCVDVGERILAWRNCEVVCECACMHMCRGESHTQRRSLAFNTLWAPVSERGLFEALECLAVCPTPFWHAGPRALLTVRTTRDPLNEAVCAGVRMCVCELVCNMRSHANEEWVVPVLWETLCNMNT